MFPITSSLLITQSDDKSSLTGSFNLSTSAGPIIQADVTVAGGDALVDLVGAVIDQVKAKLAK